MTSEQQNQDNQQAYANYETLGESETILVGKTGFVEVAHRRATLKDGSVRDFVLIARGKTPSAGLVIDYWVGEVRNRALVGGSEITHALAHQCSPTWLTPGMGAALG